MHTLLVVLITLGVSCIFMGGIIKIVQDRDGEKKQQRATLKTLKELEDDFALVRSLTLLLLGVLIMSANHWAARLLELPASLFSWLGWAFGLLAFLFFVAGALRTLLRTDRAQTNTDK